MAKITDADIKAECERRGLRFRPWEVAPWQADEGPCPWPPATAGARSWPAAQRLRREIVADLAARAG